MPVRIALLRSAKWSDDWGKIEGKGDHPPFSPLTVSEIVDHDASVIQDHVGATIIGAEIYQNAIGLPWQNQATLFFPHSAHQLSMIPTSLGSKLLL
jgi:hypothetical protein